jgi:molybdopterin-synthase adenylyltransferase
VPKQTGCLACLYPEPPPNWKREFPVFGAVSGMVGCLGAMEAIKLIAHLGQPLAGELLTCDLLETTFRKIKLQRNPQCRICGAA